MSVMRWLKRLLCRHVFVGLDLGPRDVRGKVTWPCSKCGRVFRFGYGLQAADRGAITGPWVRK